MSPPKNFQNFMQKECIFVYNFQLFKDASSQYGGRGRSPCPPFKFAFKLDRQNNCVL